MKKLLYIVFSLLISSATFGQSSKALAIVDGMQKMYKSLPSFSANFSYQTDGNGLMTGSITVRGTKFRLKTAGQEIFNNGKEVSTYIKEINEVNISGFDPEEGDLNPAKIYSFDKKQYKINLVSESAGISTLELAPTTKSAQIQKITLKIESKDFKVKEWTIVNKVGKKQNFKITKFNPNAGVDDAYFTFNKKSFPGVSVNDLR
jgi:outer membrane lipoprotein-sorting protein